VTLLLFYLKRSGTVTPLLVLSHIDKIEEKEQSGKTDFVKKSDILLFMKGI